MADFLALLKTGWDSVTTAVGDFVDAGKASVKDGILKFANALKKAETNYAELQRQNGLYTTGKIKFKSEADKKAFAVLLAEGKAAVEQGRAAKAALLPVLKAVNANPADYGLGALPALLVPVGVVAAMALATTALINFTSKGIPATPSYSEMVKSGIPPETAATLATQNAKAAADTKSTADRLLDNAPLILGGLAAVVVAPSVVAMLPKPDRE